MKTRLSSRISHPKIEMKIIPADSKTIDPNESSLLRIQKEVKEKSFFEDLSETKRKSIDNEDSEENNRLRNEISSLKQENIEMNNLIKSYEKKNGELELEIENLKICNMILLKENKALVILNSKKTLKNNEDLEVSLEDKINSFQEIKNEEKSSKNMNSIKTKQFKEYFEDNLEIIEESSEKNKNIKREIQNENFIKIWNHQENNLKLDFPHFTIVNFKKTDNNILKKIGIITIDQQILNATKHPIIIEFSEFDSSEGILKHFVFKISIF